MSSHTLITTPLLAKPKRGLLIDDVVQLTIKNGQSFPITDIDGGSDPYVVFTSSSNDIIKKDEKKKESQILGQTKVMHNNLNPIWNEKFEILYNQIHSMDSIRLHILDKDHLSKDVSVDLLNFKNCDP